MSLSTGCHTYKLVKANVGCESWDHPGSNKHESVTSKILREGNKANLGFFMPRGLNGGVT